jgi:hypothetical protein
MFLKGYDLLNSLSFCPEPTWSSPCLAHHIRPPAPLKGGSIAVFNKVIFMSEYEPPFRGVGGQNK